MKKDFKQAKKIIKYLEGKYGKIGKHTIEDDITIVNDISNHYNLEELKMMKKRLIASIQLNRDISYMDNHPTNLMIAFFTAVSAVLVAMATMGFHLLISYSDHLTRIYEVEMTPEMLNDMVEALNFSDIIMLVIVCLVVVCLVMFAGIYLANRPARINYNKIYKYNLLIEEALEKKLRDGANIEHREDTQSIIRLDDNIYEIMKYKVLLDEEIITLEEFEAKRKQILGIE